jgi:cyclophilin family peptidyl-prolyl cis-trans isomerase
MDKSNVVFGRVISGMSIIDLVDNLETANEKPITPV